MEGRHFALRVAVPEIGLRSGLAIILPNGPVPISFDTRGVEAPGQH